MTSCLEASRETATAKDEAAFWFAKMHGGEPSRQECEQFMHWKASSVLRSDEYQLLETLWQASYAIPEQDLRAMLAQAQACDDDRCPAQSAMHRGRRRWWSMVLAPGAAAAAMVLGGVLLAPQLWKIKQPDGFEARYATAVGTTERLPLPDGSVLTLNTNSIASVTYSGEQRLVALEQGEALFEVAHIPGRGFHVDTPSARVTVTGTVFSVRQHANGGDLTVIVKSGAVEVSPRSDKTRHVKLTADQSVAVSAGQLQPVRAANAQNQLAWQTGKLVFSDQPLSEVVQELNRYLSQPIYLEGPQLHRYRVSGVFNVSEAQGLVDTLTSALPLKQFRRPDGSTELRER